MSESHEIPRTTHRLLSPELQALGVDLDANAANYPEMQWQLSELDAERVAAIRSHLANIPFVHTTHNVTEEMLTLLRTNVDLGISGRTRPLDRSLGLDHYVFMHWGASGENRYGDQHMIFKPTEEMWDSIIVTPYDLAEVGSNRLDTPYEDFDAETKDAIKQIYLDQIVTGNAWLDIVARRIWSQVVPRHEAGFSIGCHMLDAFHLGEIKHQGSLAIPPGILTVLERGAGQTMLGQHMLAHGFVPPEMTFSRESAALDKKRQAAAALQLVMGLPEPGNKP